MFVWGWGGGLGGSRGGLVTRMATKSIFGDNIHSVSLLCACVETITVVPPNQTCSHVMTNGNLHV